MDCITLAPMSYFPANKCKATLHNNLKIKKTHLKLKHLNGQNMGKILKIKELHVCKHKGNIYLLDKYDMARGLLSVYLQIEQLDDKPS